MQRVMRCVLVASLAAVFATIPIPAQPLGSRIKLDSLQLSALSIDAGHIVPSQSEPATIIGIAADYGRLSNTLRLRFEGSFWESRLSDHVVQTFLDSLRRRITDPSRDDLTTLSRVSFYDVTMGVAVRYLPMQGTVVQPYGGVGVGVHVINAEGPVIDGTFAERLFDNISTGLFAESGVIVKPLRRIGVDVRLRGDLVNGFRSYSVRAGGIYWFGPLRRSDP